MRVSTKQVFDASMRYTSAGRARVAEATERVASGYRVRHPSEDPVAVGEAARQSATVTTMDAIKSALSSASSELERVDGALGGAAEVLSRARELAVQMANDTYSALDRSGAAAEVRGLIMVLTSELNVEHGGRYLFGGHKTGAPPFDETGAYFGDAGERRMELAPGVSEALSLRGDEIALGAGGGVNLYQTLSSLVAALDANDSSLVRATLDGLDGGIGQLSAARAEVGARMRIADVSARAAGLKSDDGKARAAALLEQDVFAGSTDLAEAHSALEAIVAAAARSFDISLLERM